MQDLWYTMLIADGIAALSRMRKQARISKTAALTMEDIDSEIRASRKN